MEKLSIFETKNHPKMESCHASSIIALPNNELYATWWAGTREKARDANIWGARYNSGEPAAWSEPRVIGGTPDHFNGTPVLYLDPNHRLFLFYRSMHHGRIIKGGHTMTDIRFQTSEDLGKTWDDWQYLRKLWCRVIRCKAIRLPSGRVIMPFHRELFQMQSRFYINDDPYLKKPWKTVGRLKVKGGCLEPSVCYTKSEKLLCSMRTYKAGRVYFAESHDEGDTWTEPVPSKVPNPNSQTDIICLKNGHILMACNPIARGREELSIIRSLDDGKSWDMDNKYVVESEPNAKFSYPCLYQSGDGVIHMSYTYKREAIKHFTFRESECFE